MPSRIARRARAAACILLLSSSAGFAQTRDLWHELATRDAGVAPESASTQRVFDVDTERLRSELSRSGADARIELPLAHGGFGRFTIEPSDTMHPELAAKFPEIRSLRGRDEMGRRLRLDVSPYGINAMIFADDGVQVIRPQVNGSRVHESFARADYLGPREGFRCEVEHVPSDKHGDAPMSPVAQASHAKTLTGGPRRNYRLALAGTGEYSTAVCAPLPVSVSCGLAAMVTTMNRVNEVYENDFSTTMTLIPNNNLVVYTNGATDPYTNNNGSTMLGQNQTNITSVIGSGNYDVGHVFSTGGGGVASLGVTCVNGSKARGVTGRGNPTGDPFDIDYVAHEIGHQFGGDHTFNGTSGSCGGGNRSGSSAYEPGSGSTIQAYAGICGAQDLQPNSDPYFHARSLDQMEANIVADTCWTSSTTGNSAPVIAPLSNHTIPARTPFVLTAQATDPDVDDVLTYAWEQYDVGTAQSGANPDPANSTMPLVRSFNPTPDPERIVPRLATVLGAPPVLGEVLPTGNRSMRFRVTVRDNHIGGGMSQSADTVLTVRNTGAAFAITSPDTAATEWSCGADAEVTWDVAGTDAAPISCAAVDLTLSDDGGIHFDHVLASAVPNAGTATVRVPFALGDETRIRARCSNNIFFDINGADFSVVDSAPQAVADAPPASYEDAPRTFVEADLTGNDIAGSAIVLLSVTNAVGGVVAWQGGDITFTPDPDAVGIAGFDYTITDSCERGAEAIEVTGSVQFDVLPVNDAPTLALLGDQQTDAVVGASTTVAGFASAVAFGPADEAGQSVAEFIVAVDSDPDAVLDTIAIDASGALTYTTTGNSGSATVRVTLRDDGGVDNGGVDLSEPQTFVLTASQVADVRVSKSNGVDGVTEGARTQYVLTLTNVGNVDAGVVTLLDTLPAGLDDANWTCVAQGTTCPSDDGQGDVDLDVAMPVAAEITVTVDAEVVALPGDTITNTVQAILPDGAVDAVPVDNSASDSDLVAAAPPPDVRVSKSNGDDRLVTGTQTRYVMTLENVGAADVAQVQFADIVPAGLQDATWTCTAQGTTCPVDDGEGDVVFDVALPIGASVTVELVATVTAEPGSTLTNTLEAILPDGEIVDANPADNLVDDSDAIVSVALFSDDFESAAPTE